MPLQQAPKSVEPPKGSAAIEIRPYRHEDHAGVTKLFSEVVMILDSNQDFRYLWEEHLHHELANDMADVEASHVAPGGNLWVAIVSSPASAAGGVHKAPEIVGMAGLMNHTDGVGNVRRVFVDPSCHRMGIGRKLMGALEQWARKHGYSNLFLMTDVENTRNLSFYKSLGYTQQQEGGLVLWETTRRFEMVRFTKEL